MSEHNVIKFSMVQSILIFLKSTFGCLFVCPLDRSQEVYDIGQERFSNETDIVEIVKSIRDMKILLKNTLMDPVNSFKVNNIDLNVIDLETKQEELFEAVADKNQTEDYDY